jgi:hypothetical protein
METAMRQTATILMMSLSLLGYPKPSFAGDSVTREPLQSVVGGWSPMGAGFTGPVAAVAWDGSAVIAGGEFIYSAKIQVNHVSRWDGLAWSAMGNGFNGNVLCLAADGSHLFAGGDFSKSGSVNAKGVARWDGSGWVGLSGGAQGIVHSLAMSGLDLFAGGFFTTAGGVTVNHIARWNGTAWFSLQNGIPGGVVHAMAVDGQNLYAGGLFAKAGNANVSNIARWDGTEWHALGGGLNGDVRALAALNGIVYAGGAFTSAGGVQVNRIARWDGAQWQAMGGGMDGQVTAVAVSGREVFAGGYFLNAGGSRVRHIAKWNGSQWLPLESGTDSHVLSIAPAGNEVYVGGQFWTAGGKICTRVAWWHQEPVILQYMLTLEAQPEGGGSLSPPPGFHICNEGDEVAISAVPSEGYVFVKWSGNTADSLSPSTTVTVNGDMTVRAFFERITHRLTMEVEPDGGGITSPATGFHIFNEGDMVAISAVPSEGYVFLKWSGDAADSLSAATTVTLTGDRTVRAFFERIGYFIAMDTDPAGIPFQVDGESHTGPAAFAWTHGSVHALSVDSLLDGGEGTRFVFSGWRDGGARSRSVTVVSDTVFTAVFSLQYRLGIATDPPGYGHLEISPLQEWYEPGSTVMVEAFSDSSFYEFSHWGGDLSGTANPDTLIMDNPKQLTAYFIKTDVRPHGDGMTPGHFALYQNFPNPFNSFTRIGFQNPRKGNITVDINALTGRRVRRFIQEADAGAGEVLWDGKDERGHDLPGGIYFYTMKSPEFCATRKLVYLR